MRIQRLLLALALPCAPVIARADRHPVFSLIDNRALGHPQRQGGLYLATGGAGMAKYLHFGRPLPTWKLRAVEEGRRVGLPSAQAMLEVPLTAAQAAARVLHIGLKGPAGSSLKVSARGKSSAALPLQGSWQTLSIPLPDGALAAGENRLTLQFAKWGSFGGQGVKAAAAVEFVQVGGSVPSSAAALARPAITLAKGDGVAHYAFIPRGGAISASGDAGGCQITLRLDGGNDQRLPLDGKPVDLAAFAGRFVRLDLGADGATCTTATLKSVDLLADGAAPVRAAANPPKNVVFWMTDDTRADKYRLYNPKSRVETPVFDSLAQRSTLFKVAYTPGNESRVSHASLWSSTYPAVHKMIPDKAILRPEFVTLAESLKESGRYRIGVMGNGYINARWGFGDGWDWFKNNLHQGGGLKADDLFATAKQGLDAAKGRNFFLYLGTIDVHVSWRAHQPWLAKYDPTPYNGRFVKACIDPDLDKIVAGTLRIDDRDRTRIIALYDSDISYNDQVFGKLIEELKRRGHDGDTMYILTADHGEELWDKGRIGHGQSLRQELVHVPLLIHYPPYFPAGRVVEEGVEVLDLLPTITDALGIAPPEGAQGESLIPLAQGFGAGYPRPAIASQYELAHTMRLERWKIRVGGNGEVNLFDGVADPREDHELGLAHPVELRALTDAMGTYMAYRTQWKKRRWGVASNLAPGFSAELDK